MSVWSVVEDREEKDDHKKVSKENFLADTVSPGWTAVSDFLSNHDVVV